MGFWTRTLGLEVATRSDPAWDAQWSIGNPLYADHLGVTTTTGEVVNECTAMTLSAVYRSVALTSGTIATLPLRAIKDSDGVKDRANSWLDKPFGPDIQGTPYEWVETVVAHLLLWGNAYLFKLFNAAGQVVGGIPVHPGCVTVKEDRSKPGWRVFCVSTDHGVTEYTTDQILHIPGLSFDGLVGLSVLSAARNSFGLALAGEKSAAGMFKNGAQFQTLVTPVEDLTPEDAAQVATDLRSKLTGTANASGMTLISRKFNVSQLSMSAADAQFLESRVFQIEDIARWFGIPPHLLGQTEKQTSWGAGVAEQNEGLARFVLSGITSRIEQRLFGTLPSTTSAEFDYSGFLRPAPKDEIALVISQMNGGLITPNEARAIRNLPPLPGGDTLRLPPGSLTPEQMTGGPSDADSNAPADVPPAV